MAPLYTLLLCLPAALALIACGGWPLCGPRRQGPPRTRPWAGSAAGVAPMRQHGSMQPGKQARSLAALWEQKGGKHPTSSHARARKLLAPEGIKLSSMTCSCSLC
jgi:hypothetical protein